MLLSYYSFSISAFIYLGNTIESFQSFKVISRYATQVTVFDYHFVDDFFADWSYGTIFSYSYFHPVMGTT